MCGCHCQGAHKDASVTSSGGRGAAPRFPVCAWLVLHVVPPMGLSGASPPALLALPLYLEPVLSLPSKENQPPPPPDLGLAIFLFLAHCVLLIVYEFN